MITGLMEPLTQREIILIGLLGLILLVMIFRKAFKKKPKALPNIKKATNNIHRHLYDAFLENKKLQEFFKAVESM